MGTQKKSQYSGTDHIEVPVFRYLGTHTHTHTQECVCVCQYVLMDIEAFVQIKIHDTADVSYYTLNTC